MIRRKRVWKIVSTSRSPRAGGPIDHEYLTSGYIYGAASCDYARGYKTTGVRGTPLLAFSSLQAAREWYTDHAHVQIWRALAEEPVECPVIGTFDMTMHPDKIEAFWNEGGEMGIPAPTGTVACQSIELVEREEATA